MLRKLIRDETTIKLLLILMGLAVIVTVVAGVATEITLVFGL